MDRSNMRVFIDTYIFLDYIQKRSIGILNNTNLTTKQNNAYEKNSIFNDARDDVRWDGVGRH